MCPTLQLGIVQLAASDPTWLQLHPLPPQLQFGPFHLLLAAVRSAIPPCSQPQFSQLNRPLAAVQSVPVDLFSLSNKRVLRGFAKALVVCVTWKRLAVKGYLVGHASKSMLCIFVWKTAGPLVA